MNTTEPTIPPPSAEIMELNLLHLWRWLPDEPQTAEAAYIKSLIRRCQAAESTLARIAALLRPMIPGDEPCPKQCNRPWCGVDGKFCIECLHHAPSFRPIADGLTPEQCVERVVALLKEKRCSPTT